MAQKSEPSWGAIVGGILAHIFMAAVVFFGVAFAFWAFTPVATNEAIQLGWHQSLGLSGLALLASALFKGAK